MKNNYNIPTLFVALVFASHTIAATGSGAQMAPPSAAPLKSCTSVTVDAPTNIVLGKSSVVKLDTPAVRMVVGGLSSSRVGKPVESVEDKNASPGQSQATGANLNGIADVDVMLLSPTELFFIGKRAGTMNVVLQSADGRCTVKDLIVTIDPNALQAKLAELMPAETDIRVRGAENALVLTGKVSNAINLDQVMSLATSYGDGKKVVNMLRITAPQQVMLEVKIAEVSKTLLDKFGIDYTRINTSNGFTSRIISGIIGGGPAVLGKFNNNSGGSQIGSATGSISGGSASAAASLIAQGDRASLLGIDAQNRDGLVRVLAEPNIMAISGQQASFLSGGKIFIPVALNNNSGVPTITLEEKEYGIGVKFTPTVLDGTLVNLKMVSEVSELSQTGSPFATINGVVSVLPSFTVRRADTTVQLNDGQSFVIAGLIKNDITETIKRFPGLGEIPILGALFRSTEFQKDQTELLFVITPRLVKPLAEAPRLPTDNHVEPSRSDVFLNGRLEGSTPAPSAPAPEIK